jgi:hypothetical protein
MNEHDELADLFPPDRPVTPERRQEMKERLMVQVREAEQTGRRRYRAIAGGVAAAVLVAAGLVVLLTRGDSGSDADNGDRVDVASDGGGPSGDSGDGGQGAGLPAETYQQVEELVGGRPSLDAESIGCVAPGTMPVNAEVGVNEQLSHGPLDQPLTREALILQCTNGGDWNGTGYTGLDQGVATACVREGGYGPPGNTRDDSYPLAVVAVKDLPCDQAGDAGVTVREMTDDDLAQLNHMRDMEVQLLSDPRPCPTAEEGEQWARDQIAELGLDAELIVDDPSSAGQPGTGCGWRARIYWNSVETAPVALAGLVVSVTPYASVVETG